VFALCARKEAVIVRRRTATPEWSIRAAVSANCTMYVFQYYSHDECLLVWVKFCKRVFLLRSGWRMQAMIPLHEGSTGFQ
jgi:hypothetical protein